MKNIRNIIFDLGGVIIHLDFNRTRKAFLDLGLSEFDSVYSKAQQNELFDEFDKGNITPASFRDEIRKHIGKTVSDAEIDNAWNAMLLDVPEEKLRILKELQTKYRTFLLSNTNVIHVESFSAELKRVHNVTDFTDYFEKCYYSCDIGRRKPDVETFQFVLDENGLSAAETLFIDDSPQHLEGAMQCGIQTFFHEQNQPLRAVLEHLEIGVR